MTFRQAWHWRRWRREAVIGVLAAAFVCIAAWGLVLDAILLLWRGR